MKKHSPFLEGSFSRYGGWSHCPSRWQGSQPLWGPSDFGRHWAEGYENGRGTREPISCAFGFIVAYTASLTLESGS